jgi:hypothetical protein
LSLLIGSLSFSLLSGLGLFCPLGFSLLPSFRFLSPLGLSPLPSFCFLSTLSLSPLSSLRLLGQLTGMSQFMLTTGLFFCSLGLSLVDAGPDIGNLIRT